MKKRLQMIVGKGEMLTEGQGRNFSEISKVQVPRKLQQLCPMRMELVLRKLPYEVVRTRWRSCKYCAQVK